LRWHKVRLRAFLAVSPDLPAAADKGKGAGDLCRLKYEGRFLSRMFLPGGLFERGRRQFWAGILVLR
jgi:hypothetical protein